MFHLPENTSFDEFVITVCLDIFNVAFFFFQSIIAINDQEKRLMVVNYTPNKPLILRKRICGLKDRLK